MTYAKQLIKWFEENKREMPWRKTSNPYYIWVSEVMLQQTQVETVIPYYLRFVERFPTIQALAEASLEEVHQYWEGLGYYRRAENLQKGAKLIMERWGGIFPNAPELIKEIPSIGPYTLGAVGSIAFHLPLPAVDGNVMRVMARRFRISEDIGVAKNRRIFEDKVMSLMPHDPNRFNQGLMELGALICTPKNPKCDKCPVANLCEAHQWGEEENYPVKLKKVKKQLEEYNVVVVQKGDRYGLMKRGQEGLLANLWGFPMVEKSKWIIDEDRVYTLKKLDEVTHIFTHKKWHMVPVVLKWSQTLENHLASLGIEEDTLVYIRLEDMKKYPIATAFKKVIKHLK